MNSATPAQMNPNEIRPSAVSRSPTARPIRKPIVGPVNCRKPTVESGRRRVVQAKNASGATVTGPIASRISVIGAPVANLATPAWASQSTSARPGSHISRLSTKRPA